MNTDPDARGDARESADAARLAVVRSLDVVGTPPETAFDALAAGAARIAGCPIGVISIVDAERLWFKARVGLDVDSIPRAGSCCALAIESPGLCELPDLLADDRFQDHPLVGGGLRLRFYAAHPIEVMGHNVGTLCVLDYQPRQLAPEDRALLAQLSRTAAELLLSRRRRREAAHERQRLLDFGRAGGDWMWESDAVHRYVWLSENFDASTGLSGAAQIGLSISDSEVLNPDGTLQQPALRYHEVLDRHADFARVLTTKPSPHGVLYLSRSGVPIFDAAGRFSGYRGTVRNVTAQLLAQRKLHERDLLLAKIGSQVPGVIFQYRMYKDGSASFPYASERTRELLGTAADHGRQSDGTGDPEAPFRLMLPDDRQSLEQAIVQSARTLKPLMQKARVVRTDGSLRWIDIFATPERLPDSSTLWHGFAADITERRNTEQALHLNQAQWELAAEAAAIGLARLSLADRIVRFDARACANHGLPHPAPPLTLSDWMNTVEPEDRRGATAGVRRVLSEGVPFEGRYRVRQPGGQVRWLEFVVRPTRGPDGAIDGLTGICRDVHDQQTGAQIERARQDAERASEAKSQFLSRLSHELRTPLNGILGFAQLMARDAEQPLPPRQTERLMSMQRAGAHLLGLIDDVLEISRTGASEGTLRSEPVDLRVALNRALAQLQALAQERRIALQPVSQGSADEPATDAWALAERRRVEQVLMNLLSNAIKYSAQGSRVSLGLVRRGREIGVAVRDEGPGLDADQRARLFQPFDRLGAERLLIEGIGLGLFIARQLAEAMGGRIEVDSAPGAGSTFTLWLQRAEGATTADEGSTQPAAVPGGLLPTPLGVEPAGAAAVLRQIVYIEDESLNQLLLQEMLRPRTHWRLHIAPDGATGLRLARELRPDLLLIDINLPDTSGLALVRELRAEPELLQLRCIALSADAMQDQIKAALAAGFDDYWTKPLSVSHVLASLDSILG